MSTLDSFVSKQHAVVLAVDRIRESEPNVGTWHAFGFSTFDWVAALEHVALHYRNVSQVVAIELLSNIFDQNLYFVTWGADRTAYNTDWYAAASYAQRQIHSKNPKLLIFLPALCHGFDLRDITADPLRDAVLRRKLVYSVRLFPTHTMWWLHEIDWDAVKITNILLIIAATTVLLVSKFYGTIRSRLDKYAKIKVILPIATPSTTRILWNSNHSIFVAITSFFPVGLFFIATGEYWKMRYISLNCNTVASNMDSFIAGGYILAVFSVVTYFATLIIDKQVWSTLLLQFILIWTIVISTTFLAFATNVNTFDMLVDNVLFYWPKTKAPVFVSDHDRTNHWVRAIVKTYPHAHTNDLLY
jgi:hypothetical protein